MSRHRRRATALALLAVAAGLGMAPSGAVDEPATTPEQRRDALELRRDADDIEKRLATSGLLYGDAGLDAYVQSIADGLRRPADPEPIRVRVLKGPWPNAFVLPNGASYVTTAMLDMLDNEAQLACVVGHEMSHLVDRHALQEMRALRTREGWTAALAAIVGAAGAYYGGGQVGSALANLTASAGQLWTLTAVSGYSRDHERQADRQGFERFVAAGYDSTQAPQVFELLKSRSPDVADGARPYFATHPKLDERVASFRELAADPTTPQGGRVEAERYFAALGELPLEQALLLIKGGDAASAQLSVDRFLVRNSDSARAHFVAGEAWGAQAAQPGNVERAIESYGRAAELSGTPPEALRNKGLLHRERGEDRLARDAFERYLALDPQAVDAGVIRLYLLELGTGAP